MLSLAVEKLLAGSQLLVSIMLSTHNASQVALPLPSIFNHASILANSQFEEDKFMLHNDSLANATVSRPSPFNKDVKFPEDIYALILWAFAWAALHAMCARFVFSPLSFYVVPVPCIDVSSKDPDFVAKHNEAVKLASKTRVKFQTSTWRAFLYGISTILGIYIAMNESWSLDPKSYFEGYPHKTTFWLKLYYNIGFGNYAYQLINIFYEPKQSDFFQMVAHHCATVIVMLLSYVLGFTRAGVMILLLHDCSDPLMEIAKSFLYANRQAAADAFFALFATTFLITRDFIYPVYIVAPLFTYSKYEDGVQMPRGYGHYFYVIGACLYVLQALNVFWGCLIVKMVAKVLSSGSSAKGDIRDTEE